MSKVINLINRRFGRLTVIERVENDSRNNAQWKCICDCGNECKVITSCLLSGHTQSCGCLQKEMASIAKKKYNQYDLSGEYGIGYTNKGEEFYFDLEDYDKIKDYCWCKSHGYILAYNGSKNIKMHRLIMSCPDDLYIDHINHIRHDNRKNNLRIVTIQQNSMNSIKRKDNTSGVTGVYWDKSRNMWRALITVNNKDIYLGRFINKEDAIKIRKEAEIKYFGEYVFKES